MAARVFRPGALHSGADVNLWDRIYSYTWTFLTKLSALSRCVGVFRASAP